MGIGSRAIKELFEEQRKVASQNEDREAVLKVRNEAIASRAYYYLHIKKYSYPYAAELIAKEFYLSKLSIERIIQANLAVIKRLINSEATAEDLKEIVSHLDWDVE